MSKNEEKLISKNIKIPVEIEEKIFKKMKKIGLIKFSDGIRYILKDYFEKEKN